MGKFYEPSLIPSDRELTDEELLMFNLNQAKDIMLRLEVDDEMFTWLKLLKPGEKQVHDNSANVAETLVQWRKTVEIIKKKLAKLKEAKDNGQK